MIARLKYVVDLVDELQGVRTVQQTNVGWGQSILEEAVAKTDGVEGAKKAAVSMGDANFTENRLHTTSGGDCHVCARHARHKSHVTSYTSHVTRHTSHVTRHTSHVTRHTSHVTRHTSHVTRRTAGAPLQCA